MEFMIVNFPVARRVWVDGAPQGWTNIVLQLETGEHEVTLAGRRDFSPLSQRVLLENTAALDPVLITFHPLPASAVPPSPAIRP